MPPPSRQWPRIAGPVRSLLDRSALGGLVVLSALLLVLAKADIQLTGYMGEAADRCDHAGAGRTQSPGRRLA